ncbi:phosphate ABC transporter ATP-binding protein [candidate division WOR-1 bacterium RIFOXYA12_FULL_52_29]|uniref:Phosphate ABC transporter ATP-binding protein n=1 Tax=candidate division WOR-1 bacterium RIFOXYC12_FULL_54_18 TaxID=1802584 RepID=A0A1F4T8P0_UNCSA|nr:MAG: phosphate ABC transporter ATP-binding protein [candidate division WOR-1 bacterium RIFOXYA2_FULL_51_19]OGC18463.1 MAG: phosphate ABC transporter ATP-binding protein [candidate division WOR-1 bacterium RIFOXYA12_FULL_52_29]OGC27317.1 MAG: phosphate ABC transporter ATP-binding protein [candidate division WOR-1 bacterium RIFOXYB2_FULL_45_9]OGC28880.1 MAG: phosphate ABC transporter ATP-binding protein [candidate division WOR-1 bacterium RIFOXYC12_FULL_54_18]OGC29382.1 MAG: phosphate ABC tran
MPIKMKAVDLNAWFSGKQALSKINMDVYSNKVTAVIGPSGCGKSTFVRNLNRLHETIPGATVEGAVFLDEENIFKPRYDLVDLRRRVGMVFQKPTPFPTMSIYENAAAGIKLAGRVPRPVVDQAVETALKQAALWNEVKDCLDKPGIGLSGGQQQRLCIARTLAVRPEVILLDEPCSALDPISTGKIEELIHELKKEYAIVIVTHNMQQAARVADFTGFFLLGELVEFDVTGKIFTAPRDKRTEDYVTGRFG